MNIAIEMGAYGVRAVVQNKGKTELVPWGSSATPYLIPPLAFVTKHGDIVVGKLAELCDMSQGDRIYLDEMEPVVGRTVEVYSALFALIKTRINALYEHPISSVTMVVPPYYQSVDPRKNNILEAWKRNGVGHHNIAFTSSAVAVCYKCLNLSPDEFALVFDVGHSGTTLSVIKRVKNEFQTVSHRYVSEVGGRAFCNLIYSDIEEQSQLQYDSAMQLYQVQNIYQMSHAIMETLSWQESVGVDVPFTAAYRCAVSRQRFQEMLTQPLEKALSECLVCIKEAGISVEKIQKIVLTGGCAKIPYIEQIVGIFFNTGNVNEYNKKIIVPTSSEAAMFNACRGAFTIQSTSILKF